MSNKFDNESVTILINWRVLHHLIRAMRLPPFLQCMHSTFWWHCPLNLQDAAAGQVYSRHCCQNGHPVPGLERKVPIVSIFYCNTRKGRIIFSVVKKLCTGFEIECFFANYWFYRKKRKRKGVMYYTLNNIPFFPIFKGGDRYMNCIKRCKAGKLYSRPPIYRVLFKARIMLHDIIKYMKNNIKN